MTIRPYIDLVELRIKPVPSLLHTRRELKKGKGAASDSTGKSWYLQYIGASSCIQEVTLEGYYERKHLTLSSC